MNAIKSAVYYPLSPSSISSKGVSLGFVMLRKASLTVTSIGSDKNAMRLLGNIPSRLEYPGIDKDIDMLNDDLLSLPTANFTSKLTIKQAIEEMAERSDLSPTFRRQHSPPRQLEICYKKFLSKANEGGEISQSEIFLLMMIGLAVSDIERMSRCSLCPRLALFRTKFCWQHSQAKSVSGTAGEKATRYRAGNTIASFYNYYFPETPAYVELNNKTIPNYIARLLWPKYFPRDERTTGAIKKQIALSTRLIEIVGKDFEELHELQFYKRLEERLDPDEVRPKVWRWKLKRLRHWYAYEKRLNPHERKALPRYWRKLLEAARLEKMGIKKVQIAATLNVSPATISSWMKRSGTASLGEAVEFYKNYIYIKPLSPAGLHTPLPLSRQKQYST